MTKARDIASAAPAPSTVSATELGYLDGVSSAIQTQLDGKASTTADIPKSLIDAKGDLIVGSAADTAARLAVGTNDYVLTADSSATNGVKWAAPAAGGAYTLLSTTTLSGTSTTVSSISGAYKDLRAVIISPSHNGGGSPTEVYMQMRYNSDTGSNYSDLQYSYNDNNNVQTQNIGATTYLRLYGRPLSNTNTNTQVVVDIFNYANTSVWKQQTVHVIMDDFSGGYGISALHGGWRSTSAITSITFLLSANSWDNGTVYIYGVN